MIPVKKSMYVELIKFENISRKYELDMINLGTGMGYYDFRYEGIPLKAFNFSLPQENLYFDYQLLKEYSYVLKRNGIVCIVLPYCIFCADQLEETRKRYERYYALLAREIVEPYCCVPYEEWLRKDRGNSFGDDAIRKALTCGEMLIQTESTLQNWKRQLKIISFDSGEVSSHTKREIEKSIQWLEKILEYCEQKQLIPVIVVPPMSRTLLDRIGNRFRKLNYYDILDKVIPEHIRIFDYSENPYFCNPSLYGWPGFLTEDGAKEFTLDVVQNLGFI